MSTMRLSGLISGMDTESIIQELVSAKQTKVDNTKKAQTKHEWKQDAWKSLNTKLKNLQSKYVANLRFSSSYMKKTTKVSNSNAVSVITGEDAVNGVQELSVKQLAKTAYLTGGKVQAGAEGKKWDALTKISDIMGADFKAGDITFTTGGKTVDIEVTEDTTISDFLSKIKASGLNANFDAGQQRFFISAKQSGADSNFSMTADNVGGAKILAALGLQVSLKDDPDSLKQYQEYASYYNENDKDATIAGMRSLIDGDIATQTQNYLDRYKNLVELKKEAEDKITELKKDSDKNEAAIKAQEESLAAYEKEMKDITDSYIDITTATGDDGEVTYTATAKEDFKKNVEESYYEKAAYASEVLKKYNAGTDVEGYATKIEGRDARIVLNGAEFTSANNTFAVNGLTFTALAETKADEVVTVTTQDDTDGIYNMLKDFLKEYNSIINEVDKLYNADSAKGYEPLTDDEKDAMSESEAEKYETKIKDALLRRDSSLSSIRSGFVEVMSKGIEVNGKTMYLSSFGINTLSYFTAGDNEKNMYHIDGDPDDASTSGNADKLKSMIASDPDTVVSFFTQLSKNLYSKMNDLSKPVEGYRSFGSFYDDKKMKTDYDDYKTKISDLEEKLADYEDKWYKKFSSMETALAKLQSSTSAVTSLLGGS
mgnify:FL=1